MTRIDSGNNAFVSMVTEDRRCTNQSNGIPLQENYTWALYQYHSVPLNTGTYLEAV